MSRQYVLTERDHREHSGASIMSERAELIYRLLTSGDPHAVALGRELLLELDAMVAKPTITPSSL